MLKGTFVLIKGPKTNKSLSEAVAGDLLCYNNGKLYIYPSSKFEGTPIGVVVIPTSHNVYGNGSCGVMSLVNMRCDTPDTGGDGNGNASRFLWYGYQPTGAPIKYYGCACHIGKYSEITNAVQGVIDGYVQLPSNGNSPRQNPYDTDTHYNYETEYCAPSPYNEDDSRNPLYYQTTSPSRDGNALSDFNGKLNTEYHIQAHTAQPDWKTASTILNSRSSYDTAINPADCCCWRFHTVGTKQGDWYFPCVGELGYITPKWTTITTSIKKCNDITMPTGLIGNSGQWLCDIGSGLFQHYNGGSPGGLQVRAFMQAGPDIVSE